MGLFQSVNDPKRAVYRSHQGLDGVCFVARQISSYLRNVRDIHQNSHNRGDPAQISNEFRFFQNNALQFKRITIVYANVMNITSDKA